MTGRTWLLEEADGIGLVDEVVSADALAERAQATAEALGALGAATFGMTKAHLRQPVREALAADGGRIDAEVARIWASPEARAALATYVDRTLRRRPERRSP